MFNEVLPTIGLIFKQEYLFIAIIISLLLIILALIKVNSELRKILKRETNIKSHFEQMTNTFKTMDEIEANRNKKLLAFEQNIDERVNEILSDIENGDMPQNQGEVEAARHNLAELQAELNSIAKYLEREEEAMNADIAGKKNKRVSKVSAST